MTAPTSPCSPASEGSTSPSKPSDSDASDRSNGTQAALAFSNDGGPTPPDTETLLPTPQTAYTATDAEAWRDRRPAGNGATRETVGDLRLVVEEVLTLSSAGSPASRSAPQDGRAASPTNATSGPSSPASSVSFDPPWSSLKTYPVCSLSEGRWVTEQTTLLGTTPLATFSGTLPRWGSMRDGVVYEHPTPERRTDGNGSSFLHTPTTGDGTPRYDHRASPGYVRAKPVPNLDAQLADLLPTPRTSDSNGAGKHGTGGADLRTFLGDLTDRRSTDGNE